MFASVVREWTRTIKPAIHYEKRMLQYGMAEHGNIKNA
jgi:hypothetical protein